MVMVTGCDDFVGRSRGAACGWLVSDGEEEGEEGGG